MGARAPQFRRRLCISSAPPCVAGSKAKSASKCGSSDTHGSPQLFTYAYCPRPQPCNGLSRLKGLPSNKKESESLRVVATSQESESIDLPRLRLWNVLVESVMQFAHAGENLHSLFGNNLCRYRLLILKVSKDTDELRPLCFAEI